MQDLIERLAVNLDGPTKNLLCMDCGLDIYEPSGLVLNSHAPTCPSAVEGHSITLPTIAAAVQEWQEAAAVCGCLHRALPLVGSPAPDGSLAKVFRAQVLRRDTLGNAIAAALADPHSLVAREAMALFARGHRCAPKGEGLN